jgi:large subunit ribosomal protein L25
MGLSTVIKAKVRKPGSSNLARRLRRDGVLPSVFSSRGSESKPLELSSADFRKALLSDPGNRSLFTLDIEGEGERRVLVREYQIHPVSRRLLHADFVEVADDRAVTVKVPLRLTGRAAGVEKGGQLQQVEREITVKGFPQNIPAEITCDVSSLNLGQTMHLTQVALPDTLTLVRTADLPVAVVGVPKGLKAEAEAAQAAEAGAAAPAAAAKAAPAKAEKGKDKDKKKK